MMPNTETPSRRSVLKALGGVGAVAVAGGGFTAMTGSGMAANSSLDISDPNSVTTDDGNIKFVNLKLSHTVEWDGFDKPVDAVAWRDTLTLRPNSDDVSHVVYDNTQSPVLLENFSSKGDYEGWGGEGEYANNLGHPDSQHYKEHGKVGADVNWNIIVDPRYAGPKSVENPYEIDGPSVLEPTTDGETKQSGIKYEKALYFYTTDGSGYTTEDGTSVGLLDGDGVKKVEKASDSFALTVTNQASDATNTGSGSSSAE